MADERWFTVAEVAEKLGLHAETVRLWLRQGRIRGLRFGRRGGWRISESALNDFIADRYAGKMVA